MNFETIEKEKIHESIYPNQIAKNFRTYDIDELSARKIILQTFFAKWCVEFKIPWFFWTPESK